MSRKILTLAALAIWGAACADRPEVTPPDPGDAGDAALVVPAAVPTERLARLVARALGRPEFRSYLKAQLDASPYRERKLHFQRLLDREGGRALGAIAAASGLATAEVAREAAGVVPLEIYLPVPEHRAAWTGDGPVLVATAMHDRDAPVAFDPQGRRLVLDPDRPPAVPVIALVPVETDFDAPPARQECLICDDGGGGGGGADSPEP
ncbi:MAG TPA: hypothetical protein VNI61_07455, partial [Gemmatimonadales bacterium]|nr:hypothetical protein [Gemmatimonadales bacterium]